MSNRIELAVKNAAKTTVKFINGGKLEIRNASIIWPDFAGNGKYAKGKRTFNIVCNSDVLNAIKTYTDYLKEKTGHVVEFTFHKKPLYTEDEVANKNCEQEEFVYITVKVNMGSVNPPKAFLYTVNADTKEKKREKLDATTICTLDNSDLETVDVLLNLYVSPQFENKCSAYLDTIHATLSPTTPLFGGDYDDWDDNDPNVFTTEDFDNSAA